MKILSKLGLVALIALGAGTSAFTAYKVSSSSSNEIKAWTDVHVSDWKGLKNAIKEAKKQTAIYLNEDIVSSGDSDDRIVIDGKELVIDLNGHNINRNRKKSATNGHAIEIKGDAIVTIRNWAENTTSIISGGYATNGGAINIHEGSFLTLDKIVFEKNYASKDGGAIYNRGELTMVSCEIRDCEASDTAGAIYNTDEGFFNIEKTTITNCTAKNDGGAINAHADKGLTIKESTITHNKSKTEDGGAISFDTNGKVLKIYDTVISDNECQDYGGAIDVENGSVELYGCTIKNNIAADGGAIYMDGGDDDHFEICSYETNTVIEGNYARKDGGALFNRDSEVKISSAKFINNIAEKNGGALRLKDGVTTINDVLFQGNEATINNGGAVQLSNDAVLNINSASFIENIAGAEGGAIYFNKDGKSINIQGTIKADYNAAAYGPNIYLKDGKLLNVVGSLEGSSIGVSKSGKTGAVAKGYQEFNTEDPANVFFSSDDSMGIALDGDKVVISEEAKKIDPYLDEPFVNPSDQGALDSRKVASNNWMSGISGERTLNEINIPGTHDTSMRRVSGNAGTLSSFGFGDQYAITQKRYIQEQLEEGVRYMDIRLHNRKVKEHTFKKNELIDDGENLWQTHGKKEGGTYWAGDEDDNLINLNKVLDWVKSFLIRNPSECLILGFTEETYRTEENPIIRDRLKVILDKFIEENPVNPSTGRPFVYLQDNDITKDYTFMPKLKDVRGMILLETGSDWSVGGFRSYKKAGMNTAGQSTGYKVFWDKKRDDVNAFFADPAHQIALPKAGQEWDHKNTLFKIGLNCAPQKWGKLGMPDETPIYHSDHLLPELFWQKDGCFYDIVGKYVGWIKTDGATGKEWGKIWRSNYFEDSVASAHITVKPNLNDDNYKDKTYAVELNSEIKVPDFNYVYDEKANNNYFEGWRVGEKLYKPGETYKVIEDTTFVASWSNKEMTRDVSIQVIFNDCNNIDGLRPTSLDLLINGSEVVNVKEEDSWHATYTGVLDTLVPSWDGIGEGEGGSDTATKYRYELTGDVKKGFVLTLIHTNSAENYEHISGTIVWNDEDNYDHLRPNDGELTVALINRNTGEELDTHTFSGGDWSYSLGNNLPKYKDGEPIIYQVVIKDTSTWEHKDAYFMSPVGFNFVAVHETIKTNLSVSLRWVDDGAAYRPEKVDLHILGDGVEVLSPEITETVEDGLSGWIGQYLLSKYVYPEGKQKEIEYSIALEVEGYEVTISDLGDNNFDVLLVANGEQERVEEVEHVIELIDAIGEIEYTKECIDAIKEAQTAYDNLSDENKSLVVNDYVLDSAIREFEERFGLLAELDAEIERVCNSILDYSQSERVEKLNRLGKEIIDLTSEERNMLFNLNLLNNTVIKVASWQDVMDKIDAIGDVYPTEESSYKIKVAQTAYDALSVAEKFLVENHNVLVSAEAEYFAKYFLAQVEDALAQAGASNNIVNALKGIWNEKETPDGTSFREMWNKLSEEAQTLLRDSNAEQSFIDFRDKYVEIEEVHFNGLKPFENGPMFTPRAITESSTSVIIIVSSIFGGIALLTTIVCIVFVRGGKRKHE